MQKLFICILKVKAAGNLSKAKLKTLALEATDMFIMNRPKRADLLLTGVLRIVLYMHFRVSIRKTGKNYVRIFI